MKPRSSKRILIVGAGSIGLKHARAFLGVDPAVDLTVIDPRDDALERAAELGAKPLASDWDSLHLQNFDGVVICAPPPLHIPYTTRCLQEGVPVLSEKPLSNAWDGVEELVKLSESPGTPPSGVAYVRRYITLHERVRELLASGVLGKMLVMRINAGQPFTKYRSDYKQIYYASRKQGGGCILDFASHFIDLAQWYMGPVNSVRGYYDRLALEGVEVEDTVAVAFDFDSGALGNLNVNQFQPLNENCVDISGEDCLIRILEPGFKCMLWHRDAEDWETIEIEPCDYLGGLKNQATAFISAIDGGEPMRTSIKEAAHTLRLCLDVLKEE